MILLGTQVDSQTFTVVDDKVKNNIFPDVEWQEYSVAGFPLMVKMIEGVVVALMTLSNVRVNNSFLEEMH